MDRRSDTYTYRLSGTCGCEILDLDGKTVAWTCDDCWAAVICRLLKEHCEPIVWDYGSPDRQHGS